MNSEYRTEQEEFWAGKFGTDYIDRNKSQQAIASNIALFSQALRMAGPIQSCIEFGANIGLNLAALRMLYPFQDQYAVEINKRAAGQLREILPKNKVFEMSILDFDPISIVRGGVDLVLSKGVLIHINSDLLQEVYNKMYACAKQYILIAEYYNPKPVAINYRGHENKLFKRDFAGELMDKFTDLTLRDYGFVYHRDLVFPQDDINWFLLEKTAS